MTQFKLPLLTPAAVKKSENSENKLSSLRAKAVRQFFHTFPLKGQGETFILECLQGVEKIFDLEGRGFRCVRPVDNILLNIRSMLTPKRTTQVWDAVVTHVESAKTIALFRCTQMILWPKG